MAKSEERQVQGAEAVATQAGAAKPAEASAANPSREQLSAAVKHINKSLPASSSLEFSIDDDSKQTIVKIVDMNTKEVLRQIPSLEALEIAKSLDKMMGLLISQKA
jgi:flagellar protein FlaG